MDYAGQAWAFKKCASLHWKRFASGIDKMIWQEQKETCELVIKNVWASVAFFRFVKVTFHFPEFGDSFQLPPKLFQALQQNILNPSSVLGNKLGSSLGH